MFSLAARRTAKLHQPVCYASKSALRRYARFFSINKNKWDIDVISHQPNKLVNELHSVWAPYTICEDYLPGTFTCADQQLFESEELKSTTHFVDSDEIAHLQKARIVRPAVKGVTEINPDLLDEFTLRNIGYACQYHSLAPWLNIELRPNGLTIDSSGGASFTHERSSDDFIGTLLTNFNVDYTGGEVEVTYKDRSTVFDKKQCWVAVHKDCSYKIKPITSGSRVDMVFDIYSFDRYAAFDAVNYGNVYHSYCLDVSADKAKCIIEAVHAELTQYSTVLVNLAGHYTPNNATTPPTILPAHLTSADSTLHTMLHEHFNVTIERVEINCTVDNDTNRITVTSADYLHPTTTTTTTTSTKTTTNTTDTTNTKIVLSNRFHPDNLVWESPVRLPTDDDEGYPLKELKYHTVALVVTKRL